MYVCKNPQAINILQDISTQFENTSLMEWGAFIFGVLQVLLALKNRTINFYAGIISVSLYSIIFFNAGLYAESLLNFYYLIVSVAGIFLWNAKAKLPISITSGTEWFKAAGFFLVLFAFLHLVLRKHTASTVPLADSIVAAFAWVGSWMLVKRKLENWIVLNVSNVLAIPLFIYKGLELTALLTLIYIISAIFGFFAWRKELHGSSNSFHYS